MPTTHALRPLAVKAHQLSDSPVKTSLFIFLATGVVTLSARHSEDRGVVASTSLMQNSHTLGQIQSASYYFRVQLSTVSVLLFLCFRRYRMFSQCVALWWRLQKTLRKQESLRQIRRRTTFYQRELRLSWVQAEVSPLKAVKDEFVADFNFQLGFCNWKIMANDSSSLTILRNWKDLKGLLSSCMNFPELLAHKNEQSDIPINWLEFCFKVKALSEIIRNTRGACD